MSSQDVEVVKTYFSQGGKESFIKQWKTGFAVKWVRVSGSYGALKGEFETMGNCY